MNPKPIEPANFAKYLKYLIFGVIALIISGIIASVLIVFLIIKYFIGPAVNSLPEAADRGAQWFQNNQTQLEERLKGDEARIQLLEEKIQQLDPRSN